MPKENQTSKEADLFRKTAAEWLSAVQPQVKESTCNKYRNLLESYLFPELGEIPLERITQDMVESLCRRLLDTGGVKGSGLSPKTVADSLSVMRNVFKYAKKKGRAVSLDTLDIRIRKSGKKMRVLSCSEQERLCRYLCSDLNAYNIGILLCLFTGLRVGEVCALRWENISMDDRTISVSQTAQRIQNRADSGGRTRVVVTRPKSACSLRTIPIPDSLVSLLSAYQASPNGYFLTNSTQKMVEPRVMQSYFKLALRKSHIDDANYHSLRHTFATRCVELGFDVKSLSEILGHASINITMNRYVHPSMELKKENMQRLSRLLVSG